MQKITIKATGPAKDPTYEVSPKSVKPGAATIVLENGLDKGGTDGQMVYFEGKYTDQQVTAQFANATTGKPVAAWFQGGGGPDNVDKPGESSSVTQELKAGTYVVVPGEEPPKLPLPRIEVKGEAGASFEPPTATITATEYSYSGKGVTSGEPVLLTNAGETWHHFLASKLKPGATIEDARRFLTTEKGENPLQEGNFALSSTVLDGGISQSLEFESGPGKYAFFCFISDKEGGGPPHVQKGMVSQVVVE